MKTINLGLVLLASLITQIAQASSGDSAHGGGVIKRDWGYISFATAGVKPEDVSIKIEPKELTAQQIPGMDTLITTLDTLPINEAARTELDATVLPSQNRKYFKVDETALSQRQRDLLIEKYKEITKITADQIAIAGITDPETHDTYLLPEFYALQTDSQRAAILFHEMLWLFPEGVKGGYNFVMSSEIDMQHFIENPSHENLISIVADIGELFHNIYWSVGVAFEIDVKSGLLNDLLINTPDGPGIPLVLFCQNQDVNCDTGTLGMRQQLYYLNKKHPQSLFFAELSKHTSSITHFTFFDDLVPSRKKEISMYAMTVKNFSTVYTQSRSTQLTVLTESKEAKESKKVCKKYAHNFSDNYAILEIK